jgi:hypothetical protein
MARALSCTTAHVAKAAKTAICMAKLMPRRATNDFVELWLSATGRNEDDITHLSTFLTVYCSLLP